MTRFILQRLLLLPLLLVIFSFIIFVIIQAPPGDFLTAYVATLASSGSSISAEQIAGAARSSTGSISPSSSSTSAGCRTCCAAISACRWNISAPTPN